MRPAARALGQPAWSAALLMLALAVALSWLASEGSQRARDAARLLTAARTSLEAAPRAPAKMDPALLSQAGGLGPTRAVLRAAAGARAEVERAVEALGGRVEVAGGDWLQVLLPPEALLPLAQLPAVLRLDRPLPMVADGGPISEGFRTIALQPVPPFPGAGSGIKIGIIDSFANYQPLLGSDLPPPERLVYRSFSAYPGLSRHGTAVAEVLYDVAPGATFYLAEAATVPEVAAAVDWLLQEGVKVINMSLNAPFAPPSNGSGLDAVTVEKAARQGVIWVNAGGNFANKHWLGPWSDPNGNGLHNFTASSEVNRVSVPARQSAGFMVVLRWDDPWGGACNDYDLAVSWNDPIYGPQVLTGNASQDCSTGAQPVEIVAGNAVSADGSLAVSISRRGNAQPRQLELFVWGGTLEMSVPAHSVAPPADSANALAAGAAASWDPSHLQPYSGRGPSPLGLLKPDFVAPDVVSTATFGPMGFAGTSAAAPHLAGVVALVRQAYPAWGLPEVKAFLQGRALDLGPPGPDNNYGYGLVYMGGSSPFAPPPPPAATLQPLDNGRAWVTWGAIAEASSYRLCRSPSPAFDGPATCSDMAASGYTFAVVEVPAADLEAHYYRLQACNPFGCSAPAAAGGIVRRQWPDPGGWDFYMTASSYGGYVVVKARNLRGSGTADLELYQGLQGFVGAALRQVCAGLGPGGQCEAAWPAGSLVSAAQALGPWRVGAGLAVP
jgi:subtilisin family serine protease